MMDSLPRVPDNLRFGEEISRGAYGAVFAGLLGAKPVAIKKIHQLLLDYASQTKESLEATLSSFRRECELMEAARDPHIVKFLGAFNDERLGYLLVMELMDQTLEKFLQENRGKLSRKKQLKICRQIASGLKYLHHHDPQILHRDLTPRNILLKGNTIKISDLGQAKFRPPAMSYLTTKAPGCVLYMPPECLCDDPHYNNKGDVFSLGVVMLEVATQEPPSCSMFGIGTVPEVDRRAKDLSKVSDDHPLKALIKACLKDNRKERPTIEEVHSEILGLQQKFISVDISDVSSEIQQIPNLKFMFEVLKKEPQEFRSDVLLEGKKLQSIQLPSLPIPTRHATAVVIGGKIYVSGGGCPDVKCARLVQVYNALTAKWTELPPSPTYNSESTLVKGQLTLIGGFDASTEKNTNLAITWDEEKKEWFPKIPPMPTERFRSCIIHCNNFMLVAGGIASDNKTLLDTIDVYNMDSFQWTTSSSFKLPLPMWYMRASINSGYLFITSGMDSVTKATGAAYKLSVDEVVKAVNKKEEVEWTQVHHTPYCDSGLVAGSDHPIVVGGSEKSLKSTSDVSIYNPMTNKWCNVGQCVRPHLFSCAIAVSSSSFVVIGGRTDSLDPVKSLINNIELFFV